MSRRRAIIIGGGIGGLATANLLAKAGYAVTVYEKNAQLGGRAGLLQKDGFTFDTGPSWYLMPEVFRHYFNLFGKDVDAELDLVRLSPAYKVFFEHTPALTITSDLEQDVQTFEAIEPGAGTKLRRYVAQGDEMYAMSLRHFLYSNFSSPRDMLQWEIVARGPKMLRLATTPLHRYVGKYFHDQRLQQIVEYPMVFLGSSPFQAPALYSLMSALDFKEGVFYPMGGLYQIIERLVNLGRELGVAYHQNAEVLAITHSGKRATGIHLASGKQVTADVVISNADLHFTETKLVAKEAQTYPVSYWRTKQAGPSALLCYLGIKGKLPTLRHHNLLFVDDWRQNFRAIYDTKTMPQPASLYICKPSATDPSVAPAGHENVFVLVPLPAGVHLSQQELTRHTDSYMQQIATAIGVPDFADRIVSKTLFGPSDFSASFNAWQSTALGPSHVLSQSALLRTGNRSKKLSNLYYVGGFTLPGIGLPMCLIGAELVYKRLVGDIHGGPITAVRPLGGER